MKIRFRTGSGQDEKMAEEGRRVVEAKRMHSTRAALSICFVVVLFIAKHSAVVRLELDNALVGQRMVNHLTDNLHGDSRNICAGQCAVCDMDRIADRGGNNLGVYVAGSTKNSGDLLNELYARGADVVETAKER